MSDLSPGLIPIRGGSGHKPFFVWEAEYDGQEAQRIIIAKRVEGDVPLEVAFVDCTCGLFDDRRVRMPSDLKLDGIVHPEALDGSYHRHSP